MKELKSLDIYVEGSHERADYRKQLLTDQQYQDQIDDYNEMMDFPTQEQLFIEYTKKWLLTKAQRADNYFTENQYLKIENGQVIVSKIKRSELPEDYYFINDQIQEKIKQSTILDILIDTEKWLNISHIFGPVSGFDAKIKNQTERLLITLFCYGCYLGPTQTARSIKGISRKQVAWINAHHVTEEKLDNAITLAINAYNKFDLPKYWGDGKSASADGTQWNIYEQNLLSEFHIRYGGYGGIGYYHVSDTYIALFSHFIPCGVYEAVYILDGLLKNQSDIQPNTLHGDTQAQNESVFGLSYLLGIKLMPRIRNIKSLTLYKPDQESKFQHIDDIFTNTIDWKLIEKHLPDMLRVALSIKSGKITASSILRRLGSYNRKNKLYFAVRELGRAVRTGFILDYYHDVELRKTIQAATNKSEEYNNLIKWTAFGNNGIIAENLRFEQTKIIKYNHLVTNLLILYNVNEMTKIIEELIVEGKQIDAKVLAVLSPYRTEHINRYGDYKLNMKKDTVPIQSHIELKNKVN